MRLYLPEDAGRRGADALRWGSAGLLVVALHAGLGWWVARHLVVAKPPDTAQGIPIDLEPVATPMNAPEPAKTAAGGIIPTPQAAAAPTEPPPQPVPEAPRSPEPAPLPLDMMAAAEPPPTSQPSEPPPPDAQPATEPPEATPPLAVPPAPESRPAALAPRDTKPDAVLAPPPPKRAPDPRAVAREAARRKADADRRAQQRIARAEARAETRVAAQARSAQIREAGGPNPAQAAPSGASTGASVATWRGAVQAHLRAFTPSGTGTSGTARVSFAVDRSGRVVAASLAASSGDASLDSAAVAMVRRASPVPAPPPELGGRVGLSVPVHFQ